MFDRSSGRGIRSSLFDLLENVEFVEDILERDILVQPLDEFKSSRLC